MLSRFIKITHRFIFVILISLCLSHGLNSIAQQRNDQQSSEMASPTSTSEQSATIDEFSNSLSYAQGEPLLLLLVGIAILVGATTLKKAAARKRSSSLAKHRE
jgi:hypothetical protein